MLSVAGYYVEKTRMAWSISFVFGFIKHNFFQGKVRTTVRQDGLGDMVFRESLLNQTAFLMMMHFRIVYKLI